MSNLDEYMIGSSPALDDTDADGFTDLEERGTSDPRVAGSYPATRLQPRIQLSDDRLVFRVRSDQTSASAQSVAISNAGSGTLVITPTTSANWLDLSVFTIVGRGPVMSVGVKNGVLQPGFHTAFVRVNGTSNTGLATAGAPQCVRVEAWIVPPDAYIPPLTRPRTMLPLVSR